MANNIQDLENKLRSFLEPDARGRLLARGMARGMIWKNGISPTDGPAFPNDLTLDLLDFGYSVLAISLEIRDAKNKSEGRPYFDTSDAFRVAAESIESAIRRNDPSDLDRGRHLVVSAAAFHLAGYAARSFCLLSHPPEDLNLSSVDRSFFLLLRREFQELRFHIVAWHGKRENQDEYVADRLLNADDDFSPEDAAIIALSSMYHRAIGLFDSAIHFGRLEIYNESIGLLSEVIDGAIQVGNVPLWWTATLTYHILQDLWSSSLHVRLPVEPTTGEPNKWNELRRGFIELLGCRQRPQIDLWPSQLDAASRIEDTTDDLIVALPTSAGKTRIAELCILKTLANSKRVVYVTPLRALSAQVEQVLAKTFIPLGASVTSLYGSAGVTTIDTKTLANADIVVSTPEKLDFALRQDPDVLNDVHLIVFDEGHMIGANSREIRYEVLIQRLLRRSDASYRRMVCLSAMFNPDDVFFNDFADWLRGDDPRPSIHVKWRPTRQLLATLDWNPSAQVAKLSFIENEKPYVPRFVEGQKPKKKRTKVFPQNDKEFCIAAAAAFAQDGHNVLVYSPERRLVESLVGEFCKAHRQGYLSQLPSPASKDIEIALAIGREWLGQNHHAVKGISIGVGMHHGALPRPFLSAVENLLNKRLLPIIVASPTLAQGIDLSCSVLIFRTIYRFDSATKGHVLIDPTEFANVLGRAGRAYVDLDGIAVYPIYNTGRDHDHQLSDFRKLLSDSRKQRLVSGLAKLIWEIASRLMKKAGVKKADFLEYVLNHGDIWDSTEGQPSQSSDEESEEEFGPTLESRLEDLDLAILSLLEQSDASVEELSSLLDEALNNSLWKRTLSRANESFMKIERQLLISRAEWIWRNSSPENRQACFAAGLGITPGVFLYENMDILVPILIDLDNAIKEGNGVAAGAAAVAFTSIVLEGTMLALNKIPETWQDDLKSWVNGVAFSQIIDGKTASKGQKTHQFIQENVVYKLVWAAEAVRVQATSRNHPRADELGDGPALSLTYGVPSIPAAILCQSGYASRTGAIWLVGKLAGDFSDFQGLSKWRIKNRKELSKAEFWDDRDFRLLWNNNFEIDKGHKPVEWERASFDVDVKWNEFEPHEGEEIRFVPSSDQDTFVCQKDLTPLASVKLPVKNSGVFLSGRNLLGGKLEVEYFGPK